MPGIGNRRALLAKIHVAKKQLGLADEDYRAGLLRLTGNSSAAQCSDAQLHVVLQDMRRLGFDDREPKPRRRTSDNPQVRMIYAIWGDIRPLLKGEAGNQALRSFVQRQTQSPKSPEGIGDPEWLGPDEANKVIEGMKGWLARLRRNKIDA